jgi:hypothetical protein
VEGSESQALGNHQAVVTGSVGGGTVASLWKPRSTEICIGLTHHKTNPIKHLMHF